MQGLNRLILQNFDEMRLEMTNVTDHETPFGGIKIVKPVVFRDDRGHFLETYQQDRYRKQTGIEVPFVQDNLSFSHRGVLRGLHYQYPNEQAKLVQVLQGEVFDVAVDIRRHSPTYRRWFGIRLSDQTRTQLFIPAGFAHGFCVISDTALFAYKCSDYYAPEAERGICWSDPDLGIEWPLTEPTLSPKDADYPLLRKVPDEHLPDG